MKKLMILGLILTVVAGSGCVPLVVAAGAGAGAVGREVTDVEVVYKGNISSVDNAVRKALADLGATVVETVREEKEKGQVTIRGKTFDDKRLTIDLEPSSPSSVLVEVRVGLIGYKARAEEVHKAIQKYAKAIEYRKY